MHGDKSTKIRPNVLDKYDIMYYNRHMRNGFAYSIIFVGTFIIVHSSVLVNQYERKEVLFVNESKFTDFGLCVKTELLRRGKEQKWLEEVTSEMTGLFVDSGYMYKILTGQRNAPKIVSAIREVLGIREEGEAS